MKRKLCKLLAAAMILQSVVCTPYFTDARETGSGIAITQLPGTVVEEKSYDDSFLKVTGYVEDGVGDRSAYYWEYVQINEKLKEQWVADGNKEEDYVWQNTENYYVANDEQELCDALVSDAKVIEITADMELGYKYLEEQDISDHGAISEASDYRKGNEPISSPDLMEKGVSKMSITNKDGLTIFSRNGSTLYHCEVGINNCNDIVLRNIGIQGLNEWDDLLPGMSGTPGHHKRYDWDNIAVYASTNVWIDHCTLGIAYDGSIDVTDKSTVSITWCEIGVPDEKLLQEMRNTMDYQENLYTEGKANQFYTALRDGGASKEQIFQYSLLNDKVHAFSCNEGYYDVNIYDKITMAYNYYKNSVQRVPQIRSGNAHMFNCWIDSNDYRKIHGELSDSKIGKKTDAEGNTISPIKYAGNKGCSTLGLCRANSTLGGGTIGTDTCVFEGVINPIIGSEIQGNGEFDLGIQYGAVNHNLIVNSSTTDYGQETYIGSSWDNNGENPFVGKDYWNGGRCSMNNFKWAKWKDITKDPEQASDTVTYLSLTDAYKMKYGEFAKKFYIGEDTLEYAYQILPLGEVKDTLSNYSGCGKVNMNCADWAATRKGNDSEKCKVTFCYSMYGVKDTVLEDVTKGSVVSMPAAEKVEGYDFVNWYTKEYYVDHEGTVQYNEKLFDENTVITGDALVYAKWKSREYKISLDLNGGTTSNVTEYIMAYNTMFFISQLNSSIFTKDGYTLAGWYADKDLTSRVYYIQVKEDRTIYAKWQEVKPSPTPVESSMPEESPTPAESSMPEKSPTPAESSMPEESPTPAESSMPEESPTPAESSMPEESPTPAESSMPEESPTPAESSMPEESLSPGYEAGDVDGDGQIRLNDAQLALRAALLLENLVGEMADAADYDGDGTIRLKDAQSILRRALLLEVSEDKAVNKAL